MGKLQARDIDPEDYDKIIDYVAQFNNVERNIILKYLFNSVIVLEQINRITKGCLNKIYIERYDEDKNDLVIDQLIIDWNKPLDEIDEADCN